MTTEQIADQQTAFRIFKNRIADPDVLAWFIDMYFCLAVMSKCQRRTGNTYKSVATEFCRISRLIFSKFVENGVASFEEATEASELFALAAKHIGEHSKDPDIKAFHAHILTREFEIRQLLNRYEFEL